MKMSEYHSIAEGLEIVLRGAACLRQQAVTAGVFHQAIDDLALVGEHLGDFRRHLSQSCLVVYKKDLTDIEELLLHASELLSDKSDEAVLFLARARTVLFKLLPPEEDHVHNVDPKADSKLDPNAQ